MKKMYPIAVSLILLGSCSAMHLDYYGRSVSPTSRADIYLYERDVSVPYEVLGRADVTKSNFVPNTSDKVKNLLLTEAKQVGADAVVIYDETQTPLQSTIHTTTSKDRTVNALGDSITTKTSVTSAQAPEPVFSPVFIKYKSAPED